MIKMRPLLPLFRSGLFVIVGGGFAIETCIQHHPNDLPKYLDAWDYWKDIVCR